MSIPTLIKKNCVFNLWKQGKGNTRKRKHTIMIILVVIMSQMHTIHTASNQDYTNIVSVWESKPRCAH